MVVSFPSLHVFQVCGKDHILHDEDVIQIVKLTSALHQASHDACCQKVGEDWAVQQHVFESTVMTTHGISQHIPNAGLHQFLSEDGVSRDFSTSTDQEVRRVQSYNGDLTTQKPGQNISHSPLSSC